MNKVLIFTGSGISAESGIPTYRDDKDGVWTKNDADILSNYDTFLKNRDAVFDFYNQRKKDFLKAEPNKAHNGLAKLQRKLGEDKVKIYTQNIDNLLEKAGCKNVVHVHGSYQEIKCLSCGKTWDIGSSLFYKDELCKFCLTHGKTKPGTIFFGEPAPLYGEMITTFGMSEEDVIIVIGTSGSVVPMRYVTGNRYKKNKSFTILNNKELDKSGMIDYQLFDLCLFEPATKAINHIIDLTLEKLQ